MPTGADDIVGVMSNTKWEELRAAMHGLGDRRPLWRTKDLETGHISTWDGEWFYHFPNGGYENVEWVELSITTPEQREIVRDCLRTVHVPGVETDDGFRVFGWLAPGQQARYIG